MSGFTLRQLEIFVQVVEHGSFRRCADQLGVSQVSVSEHVRELENRLGVKLFDRNAGHLPTLTPEGERAYRRIAAIIADLNDLNWDLSSGRSGRSTGLRISVYAYIMRYLHDALANFKALHPQTEVKVEFDVSKPEQLLERVQDRELDVAYFVAFDGHSAPASELLRMEPLALFVAPDHPLAAKACVTADEIRQVPAIHLAPGNPVHVAVNRALEQAGFSGSPVASESDDYGFILTSVRHGDGFVCMFQGGAEEVFQTAGLVMLKLERPLPSLQIRMIMRHAARHDPLVNELVETLGRALKTS